MHVTDAAAAVITAAARLPADLQAMSDSTRAMELGQAGLGAAAIEGVAMFLSAMPRLSLAVLCEVEGEEEVMEKDPVHCKVRPRRRRSVRSAHLCAQA